MPKNKKRKTNCSLFCSSTLKFSTAKVNQISFFNSNSSYNFVNFSNSTIVSTLPLP